jgi:hypothetical protein
MDNIADIPIDNVVNLAEKREEAKKNKEMQELKKLPQNVHDYIELRTLQIKSIEDTRKLIKEFEETRLCFSKDMLLPGPQLDVYISYKVGVMVAVDNIKYNDEKMKTVYPSANFTPFE